MKLLAVIFNITLLTAAFMLNACPDCSNSIDLSEKGPSCHNVQENKKSSTDTSHEACCAVCLIKFQSLENRITLINKQNFIWQPFLFNPSFAKDQFYKPLTPPPEKLS